MAGFLDGLVDLIRGGDQYGVTRGSMMHDMLLGRDDPQIASGGDYQGHVISPGNARPFAQSVAEAQSPPPPQMQAVNVSQPPQTTGGASVHTPGLLSQLGSWVMSPEGRLAIGTTLRAGTGNENAFNDQQRIQSGWVTQAEKRRKDLAAQMDQAAWQASFETDANGNRILNPQKLLRNFIATSGPDNPMTADRLKMIAEISPKTTVGPDGQIYNLQAFGGGANSLGELPPSRKDIRADAEFADKQRHEKVGEKQKDTELGYQGQNVVIARENAGTSATNAVTAQGQLTNSQKNTRLTAMQRASELGIPYVETEDAYNNAHLTPGSSYMTPDGIKKVKP